MENCLDVYGDDFYILKAPYLEFATGIMMAILFQSLLLIHSLYHEFKHRHNEEHQRICIQSRILYILLQLTGLYWTILDLFRFVILPQSTTCHAIEAYSSKILPAVYYLIYLYLILLRLNSSFKGSYLESSKWRLYLLYGLTIIPIITGLIIFLVLTRDKGPCVAPWEADNSPFVVDLQYCTLPLPFVDYSAEMDLTSMLGLTGYLAWIPVINIIIGVIFGIKLNTLYSNHQDNEELKVELRSLIIKNYILSLVGSISTIVNYSLTTVINTNMFLYLDLFLNCLVIGLMFKYNKKWYQICCKCFIVLCLIICDKSKNKVGDADNFGIMNDAIQLNIRAVGDARHGSERDLSVKVADISSTLGHTEPNIKT